MNKTNFTQSLLAWYDNNKRVLPWRDDKEPYKVWVSEIMLQQTRVQTVIPYYNRFIERLPSVKHLANVDDDILIKLWEGLGYYNRVRNMKKAAFLIQNTTFPSEYNELIQLPGIGEYTAGAVLSIAFNQPYTAVDGNVLRVFARLLHITDDIKLPNVKKEIKKEVQRLLPSTRIGDFNQGLMEIGATICLPSGEPLCMICPFNKQCKAYKKGVQTLIPVKRSKKATPVEKKTVLLVQHEDSFVIEQRPSKGLLAGLYQFPLYENHLTKEEVMVLFNQHEILELEDLKKSKHIFSHKKWDMIGYLVKTKEKIEKLDYQHKNDIKQYYAIPIAFKTYKEYIIEKEII